MRRLQHRRHVRPRNDLLQPGSYTRFDEFKFSFPSRIAKKVTQTDEVPRQREVAGHTIKESANNVDRAPMCTKGPDQMNSTLKNIIIITILLAIPLGIYSSFRTDSVANHRAAMARGFRVELGTASVADRLILAFVDTRPATMAYAPAAYSMRKEQFWSFHQDALVRLKYLERREFVMKNWTQADSATPAGKAMEKKGLGRVMTGFDSGPDRDLVATLIFDWEKCTWKICDRPDVMPNWEKWIGELDARRAPPVL